MYTVELLHNYEKVIVITYTLILSIIEIQLKYCI